MGIRVGGGRDDTRKDIKYRQAGVAGAATGRGCQGEELSL